MSLSKVAPKCGFCKSGSGIYTCPKCNRKYCSSYCYKCREHSECSETFYKDWVEQSLQEKSCDSFDKENMLRILKKFEDESAEDGEDIQSDIADRFAGIDINTADENVIWQNLSEEEKLNFKAMIESEKGIETIVAIKQPWWTITALNLVSEDNFDDPDLKHDTAVRPPYPMNAKKLSELTSAKPSSCIQNNLVNMLYAYAFLCRFYNCDWRDFIDEVVNLVFEFSPALSQGRNYLSIEEALQDSIRLITSSDLSVSVEFVKSIVKDVEAVLKGPSNGKSSTFVLCALNDIKLLLTKLRNEYKERKVADKDLKKRLLLAVKKIEYFISWSLEFENVLPIIASDIVMAMLPDLISYVNHAEKSESVGETKVKPFIEEID